METTEKDLSKLNFKLVDDGGVIRLNDNASIPMDERNRDYKEYLEWLEEGNEPEPADILPEPVPARDILAEMDELKEDIKKLKAGKVDKG